MNVDEMLDAFTKVKIATDDLSYVELLSLIGTLIDMRAAKVNESSLDWIDDLRRSAEQVNSELGPWVVL